jgi:hypothetical protein
MDPPIEYYRQAARAVEKKKENKEMKESKWKWVGEANAYYVRCPDSTDGVFNAVKEHLKTHGFHPIWDGADTTNSGIIGFYRNGARLVYQILTSKCEWDDEITLDEFFNNFDKYVIKEESMKDGKGTKDSGKKYRLKGGPYKIYTGQNEAISGEIQAVLLGYGLTWGATGETEIKHTGKTNYLYLKQEVDRDVLYNGIVGSAYAEELHISDIFSDTPSFLEEIKPEPEITKEEALRAIDESLDHWHKDGLGSALKGKKKAMTGDDCSLCNLVRAKYGAELKGDDLCNKCILVKVGFARCEETENPYQSPPDVKRSCDMIKYLWAVREEVENNWQKRMEGGK